MGCAECFVGTAMNDKELADKVVALGVGYTAPHGTNGWTAEACDDCYNVGSLKDDDIARDYTYKKPHGFVRDWRVAGALMEKCPYGVDVWKAKKGWDVQAHGMSGDDPGNANDESLPRAIIAACVEALDGG